MTHKEAIRIFVLRQFAATGRYQTLLRRLQHSFRTRRWQWILGLLAFMLVNGYIVYRLYREWDQIRAFDWSRMQPGYLAAVVCIQFVGLLVAVWAWGYALNQYHPIPFRRHLKVYTLGNLARKLPGGLGIDLVSRVYLYNQHGGDRLQVSFVTLAEPLVFGIAATIVALISMMLPGATASFLNPLIPITVLAIFLALVPSPLFRALLARISRTPSASQQLRWQHMLSWAALNSITITLGGVTLFLFCRAFGVVGDTALATLIQYWAIVVLSSVLLIWIPIDVGVSNSLTVLMLATLMPMPQALLLLVAWRVWTTVSEMIWGAIGLIV